VAAVSRPVTAAAEEVATVLARIPADERALFEILLAEARYGLQPRDDVVGTRWNWSAGLLRRALLEAGGAMCHAAIIAREFGLPAVIGATGATTHIPDGALVEVDPSQGTIRVIT